MPEVWGLTESSSDFRLGFHTLVRERAQQRDEVAILEPNPWRAEALKKLWAGVPDAHILNVDVGVGESQTKEFFWCEAEEHPRHCFSPFEEDVRQRFPGQSLATSQVAVETMGDLLAGLGAGAFRATVSIDLRRGMPGDRQILEWLSNHAHEVVVTWSSETSPDAVVADQQLRQAGFVPAGRAWGEAGTGRVYVKPHSWREHLQCTAKESKVRVGRHVVNARAWWGDSADWRARRLKARVLLGHSINRRDVLDDYLGRTQPEVPVVSVRTLLPEHSGVDLAMWSATIVDDDPFEVAQECARTHDVWPVSFSYPVDPLPLVEKPATLVSPIIPGMPLTFENPEAYLATYQNSYFGVTHRKAGWDCFRHLEILASGAIPLMPDAESIPSYSMVHYPKRALRDVLRNVRAHGSPPDLATRHAFRQHFEKYQSTSAMARYLLQASGLTTAKRVLFVDECLPHHADYLSVMTLIGLKQLLGADCVAAFPIDYVYEDSSFPVSALYGRGFGYTRVLPVSARSPEELRAQWDPAQFDALVIGSVSRNAPLAADLLKHFPAHRTLWIHGEDTPPLPDDVRTMRLSGAHIFVRAIHTGS